MDGRIGERMNERERIKCWMDERIDERTKGRKNRNDDRLKDGRMDNLIRLIKVRKDGRIGERMKGREWMKVRMN